MDALACGDIGEYRGLVEGLAVGLTLHLNSLSPKILKQLINPSALDRLFSLILDGYPSDEARRERLAWIFGDGSKQ